MRVQRSSDIRNGERHPFQGVVQISWLTRTGETKTIRAKCVDISEQGVRVECQEPLEFRSNVYIQAPAHGLMGNATVRYCRRAGMKHSVGLLFSSVAGMAEEGRKRIVQAQVDPER